MTLEEREFNAKVKASLTSIAESLAKISASFESIHKILEGEL